MEDQAKPNFVSHDDELVINPKSNENHDVVLRQEGSRGKSTEFEEKKLVRKLFIRMGEKLWQMVVALQRRDTDGLKKNSADKLSGVCDDLDNYKWTVEWLEITPCFQFTHPDDWQRPGFARGLVHYVLNIMSPNWFLANQVKRVRRQLNIQVWSSEDDFGGRNTNM